MGTIASACWVVALLIGDGGSDADPLPGWAATCVGGKHGDAPVMTFGESAAFALAPGETLHPQVAAEGLHAGFAADLKIARAGRYRFTVECSGGSTFFNVLGDGGAKLADFSTKNAATKASDWVALKAGTVRLLVSFNRRDNEAARLRTLWEMEPEGQYGFAPEPIPAPAVTVPAEFRRDVERDLSAERGRVLLVELGCVNCHAATGGAAVQLERRPPIALEHVGARARGEWLQRWITDPQQLNPGCAMPTVVAGATAKRDAALLVDLFVGLVTAPADPPHEMPVELPIDPLLADRGRALYHEVGCIACHEPFDSPQTAYAEPAFPNVTPKAAPAVPFGDLARKWRVDELAKFLADPKAVRTHGRMADFGLAEPDARAIAHYLAKRFTSGHGGYVVPDFVEGMVAPERIESGKQRFNELRCSACHTLGEGIGFAFPEQTKPLAALDLSHGCLADANLPAHGDAPRYTLSDAQQKDLRAALEGVARLITAAAPGEMARRTVAEFRCLRCHEKDGHGGVDAELVPYFRTLAEADLGDEGRLPPRLTGVGGRLRSEWIEEVVANGTRARPYLAARMPKFGPNSEKSVAKSVANGFASLDGEWRSDSDLGRADERQVDPALAVAGRALVGKEGLNCITCHSFGDRPSAGTPGLDFQAFARRIRGEFWRRYALAPLRFKPGTRMPIFFVNGKSEADLLDHDAAQQIDAIWAWFERWKEMPAPDGVPSGQRLVLDVGDQPKVFRTFLERAGSRGIAVGTPAGLHFAFDAEQVRLVEAWTGEFLDVAPVWDGRGGHVAPELGPVVWSAPAGPLLMLAPPEALKGELVDPKVAQAAQTWPSDGGRNHGVHFRGYRIEAGGAPTFLYDLDQVHVEERFAPATEKGIRFTREFRVRGLPADRLLMMREPADAAQRVAVAHGRELVALRSKSETAEPAAARVLFFRSDGTDDAMSLRYGVRE